MRSSAEIEEIFTPRSAQVNNRMYVSRPDLEKALADAAAGSMNCFLIGESGNGKSWLYKHVFDAKGIGYVSVNGASVAALGSLAAAILSTVLKPGTPLAVSMSETKNAEVKVVVAEGGLSNTRNYDLQTSEPLLRAFEAIANRFKNQRRIIVIDNLEMVFENTALMTEIANAIVLLDDERFARFDVRFLLVGTPSSIIQYFERTPNRESVTNRLRELPKVGSLTEAMTHFIVKKGFQDQLKVSVADAQMEDVAKRCYFVTMGIAQRVQEYCYELARKWRDNGWRLHDQILEKAEHDWLLIGLRDSYVTVQSWWNNRRTKVARRNQVIYAIGEYNSHQFDAKDIAALVRRSFPETARSHGMGISTILSELTLGESPLLVRIKKTNYFRVCDPRVVLCIRTAVRKNGSGSVLIKKLQLT